MNKPVYLGLSILELCKILMFEFWYDYVKPKYDAKSLEESGLLIKRVSETIKNEVKEQKGGFLGMLLGNLGTSLLGNLLIGK